MSLTPIRLPRPSPRRLLRRVKQIFLILFALPFCGIGVWMGVQAFRSATSPTCPPKLAMVLGLCAVVFAGFGAAVIALALRTGRASARLESLQTLHPDSPWLWREDWASGRVQGKSRRAMLQAWMLAAVFTAVSIPLLYVVPREAAKGNSKALLALLFPLAALGLLAWAVRATRHWARYGAARFEIGRLPGAVGGSLEGALHVPMPQAPEDGVRLVITCVRRIQRGTGKSRAVHESILWQEEAAVHPAAIAPGPLGLSVPVSFAVPLDAPPTDTLNPRSSVHWVLRAEARAPGHPYRDRFEVPVFRTAESEARARRAAEAAPPPAAGAEALTGIGLPPGSGIRVGPSPRGGTEFTFGPARNPKVALGITLFFLACSGLTWFLFEAGAPEVFSAVFGFFAVLMLVGVIEVWLGVTRVRIEGDQVQVRRSFLGLGFTRSLERSRVTGVGLKIGMQHGGASGTPYYDLRIRLDSGKAVTAGRHVRSKRHAEWLALEMEQAIGVRRGGPTPAPDPARGSAVSGSACR